jgi:S-adenosylmethionine decarboxylase
MTTDLSPEQATDFVDLAPMIFRQRLVIEGIVPRPIRERDIIRYLSDLSPVLGMVTVMPPVTNESVEWGWAGWIHWETSGAHFYAWDRPLLFFSVDIYTCKEFQVSDALAYTDQFFSPTQVVHREF